jgi:outer membrane lipoprotein-sorting protein
MRGTRCTGRLMAALICISALAIPLAVEAEIKPPVNVNEVIERFQGVVSGVTDYQVRLYEWCKSGYNYERRIIDFYFMRPKLIRMDILRGNKPFDDGSVGVFRGGDSVDGRKGGILSGFVVTVSKSDEMATTARGVQFDQSDLMAILGRLKASVPVNQMKLEYRAPWYWLEIKAGFDNPKSENREIIAFDQVSLLPVYNELYIGGELVQYARWTDYILNAGLTDDIFKVKTDTTILHNRGTKTINGLPIDESNFLK